MTYPLSRRSFLGAVAASSLLAACSKGADGKADTLYVGDQRGGSKVVLEAAGKLQDLPYKIEWSAFPNAAPLLEALNAGAIDTGIGGDAAFIFSIGTGATIKAIGAQKYRGPGPLLVVPGGSPIRTMRDIAGKRIATPRGSVAHNLILAVPEDQKLPYDAVKFAFLSPQDGQAALQGGSVDGWAIWDPNATLAEKAGARIITAPGLVPSYALVFGRDGAIADKRALLEDYRRRLYVGWDWAVAHRAAYAELLHKETGVPVDVWKAVSTRSVRVGTKIDNTLIADQQRTADRYLRAGLISKHIDVRQGFDTSFT
jgi:sulfonate transport system substrate-binding protein